MPKPPRRHALVLDADGPPAVQTVAHAWDHPEPGNPSRTLTKVAQPRIRQTQWRDPEDTSTQARYHGARNITGWRRIDVVAALHHSCPREITDAHLAAANRLRRDHELGVHGAHLGNAQNDRVSGGKDNTGMAAAQIDALGRFREAIAAVGSLRSEAVTVLCRVVLDNWDLSDLKAAYGVSRDRMHGRFYAGIERLREHYGN